MKLFLIILSLFFSSLLGNVYGQGLTKTLINDNLDLLFTNKDNPFGEIPTKTVEKYFSENSDIFYFEIVYNDKVIYREGIYATVLQRVPNKSEAF